MHYDCGGFFRGCRHVRRELSGHLSPLLSPECAGEWDMHGGVAIFVVAY